MVAIIYSIKDLTRSESDGRVGKKKTIETLSTVVYGLKVSVVVPYVLRKMVDLWRVCDSVT